MKTNEFDLESYVAHFLKAIGVLSVVCFLMAISNFVGFVSVIDYRLISFLSLQDIINRAYYFIPLAIPSMLGPILFGLLLGVGSTKVPKLASTPRIRPSVRLVLRIALWIFWISLVLLPMLSAFVSKMWAIWIFQCISTLLVVGGINRLLGIELNQRRLFYIAALSILGLFLVWPAMLGQQEAKSLLTTSETNARITFGSESELVTIIYVGTDVVFYRDTATSLHIKPRDKIDDVTWFNVTAPESYADDGIGAWLSHKFVSLRKDNGR